MDVQQQRRTWLQAGLCPSLSLLLIGLSGCDPSCETLAEKTPMLELGTSMGDGVEDDFISINDGDIINPEWGPQGGQHFWASVRTTNLKRGAPVGTNEAAQVDRPELQISIYNGEDIIATYFRTNQQLTHHAGLVGQVHGLTVIDTFNPYDHPHFFPEDFDPDGGPDWNPDEAWEFALENVYSTDWTFEAVLIDKCGTEVRDSRSIRIDNWNYYSW